MADQLFGDEILRISLDYHNSARREMEGDNKLLGEMSAAIRDLVKNNLAAGKSVDALGQSFRSLGPIVADHVKAAIAAGQNPYLLQQTQRMLGRYTPERVEEVGRLSELRRSLGVESSGADSLHSELKRVAEELSFIRRRQMTQAGQFNQATGSSPIGTGLMIDVETAMRPIRQITGFIQHQQQQFSQHLVEVGAILFSFDKASGQILEASKGIYHGLQELKDYTNTILPRGINRGMLQGQSILPGPLLALAARADLFFAHNAPFDRREIAQAAPELQSMRPWLDTMRGIPWRELGQSSRALQDLLRLHGIDSGQAHRGLDDAGATIKLLAASPRTGAPNYMSTLLGRGGRVTIDQEILHEVGGAVGEIQRRIQGTLSESTRYGFARPTIERTMSHVQRSSNASISGFAPEMIRSYFPEIPLDLSSRQVQVNRISGIIGGPTVRGIAGTGGTPEPTPQGVGPSAIALQNQLSTLNEFVRNMLLNAGPLAATSFLRVFQEQSQRQEVRQGYSKRTLAREDTRSGEDVLMAAVSGTNKFLNEQRMIESGELASRRRPGAMPRALSGWSDFPASFSDRDAQWRAYHRQNMLSQSWAQPMGGFAAYGLNASDIEEARRTRNPARIQQAAMMANVVGEQHPQYEALLDIVEGGQRTNRQTRRGQRLLAASSFAENFQPMVEAGELGVPRPFKSRFSSYTRTAPAAAEMAATPVGPSRSIRWNAEKSGYEELRGGAWVPTTHEEVHGTLFGDQGGLTHWNPPGIGSRLVGGAKKFLAEEEGTIDLGRLGTILSGAARSVGGAAKSFFGGGADASGVDYASQLRGMRREDSIARMYAAANKAAETLEQFEKIIRPQKYEQAGARFNAAQEKLAASMDQQLTRTDLRAAGLGLRLQGRAGTLGRQGERVEDRYQSTLAGLRYGEINATLRADAAKITAEARIAKISGTEYFKSLKTDKQREDIIANIEAPGRAAELRQQYRAYRVQAFEAKTPEQVENLRRSAAAQMGLSVAGTGATDEVKQEFASKYYGALPGGRGGRGVADESKERLAADKQRVDKMLEDLEQKTNQEKANIRAKYAGMGVKGEQEYASKVAAIDQGLAQARTKASQARSEAEAREMRARERFSLEDAAAGGGGRGRGGGGGGGGGSFGGGARGGLDFGLGLAAFAGAAVALRELTIETTQYAARTQQLKVVTEQMARTNFVAVDSVGAYINIMRSQNQTTQSAYSVVQRMMQAQFDISKAPALSRAAQNLSTISGGDPSETLDRIMLGLVTGYTRQLHMAGLQVSRLSVNRQLRSQLGREPDDFEQRQGLLNATLLESARVSGTFEQSLTTAAGQFALLSVRAQEAKNAIGNQFLPVYGQAIQLINSGLKTVEQNPTGTSRLISGALSGAAGLGVIGTGATIGWGVGAIARGFAGMNPYVRAATIIAAAGSTIGTYYALNQDQMKVKAQSAKNALAEINAAQSQLQDATPLGEGASPEARQKYDFEHRMFVDSSKGYDNARITNAKNLTRGLAETYTQQGKDLDALKKKLTDTGPINDISSYWTMAQNLVTTGSVGGAGTSFWKPYRLGPPPGFPELGITPQDTLNMQEVQRKQNLQALHPDLKISQDSLELAHAIGVINQATQETDKLDRGFEPGGKDERARRRARNADNPLGLIDADVADFKAQMNQDLDAAKKVVEEYIKKNPERTDLLTGVNNAVLAQEAKDKAIGDKEKEAQDQRDALFRKRDQQIRAGAAAVDVAQIRADVIPGNYASEEAARQAILIRERRRAAEDAASHHNPIQLVQEYIAAENQKKEGDIEEQAKKDSAERSRREFLGVSGGQFRAQLTMLQPTTNVSNQLARAAGEELKATSAILDDERKREAQLQILVKLRGDLVNRAVEERKIEADLVVGKYRNQQELQNTIDRLVTGKKGGSQNDEALAEIEREKKRAIDEANFVFSRQAGLPGADIKKLTADLDLTTDSANKQATGRRLTQLDVDETAKRQARVDALREQFSKEQSIQELKARGPAEEAAGIQTTFQLRLQYIQKEYEVREKTIDAEKDRVKQTLDAEFDQVQKIMSLQKQRYEESRGIAGGFFEAITSGQGNAVPYFFRDLLRRQGQIMFENVLAGPISSAFKGMSGSLGGQTTVDAQGKVVPTKLGQVLGGTWWSSAGNQNVNPMLVHLNKASEDAAKEYKVAQEVSRVAVVAAQKDSEAAQKDLRAATGKLDKSVVDSTSAENSLTTAVISLDQAIRALAGLPAPQTVAGAAAPTNNTGGASALAANSALRLPSFGLTTSGTSGVLGSLLPELFPQTGKLLGLSRGAGGTPSAPARALREFVTATFKDEISGPQGFGGLMRNVVSIPREAPGQPGIAQRAFRNNNPGNLTNVDGTFKVFATAAEGFRALQEHVGKHAGRGETLGDYIRTYAPPSQNDTEGYIRGAERALGTSREAPLSGLDLGALAKFQVRQESGTRVLGGGPGLLDVLSSGAGLVQGIPGLFGGGGIGSSRGVPLASSIAALASFNQAAFTPGAVGLPLDTVGRGYNAAGMGPVFGAAFGSAAGIPIRQADVNREGMLIGDTGLMYSKGGLVPVPAGRNVVDGVVQPKMSAAQSIAFGVSAFTSNLGGGKYNLYDLLKGSEVRVKGPDRQVYNDTTGEYETVSGSGTEHLSTGQRIGAIAADAATAIEGVKQAQAGFSKGGAKGNISGVAGVLHTASVVPGPQQPIIAGLAADFDVLASLFPDPKLQRQAQIEQYMQANKYMSPVSLNESVTAEGGNLVSEGMTGIGRNSGIAGFPINVQQTYRRQDTYNPLYKTPFGSATYGYTDILGRQLGPTDDQNALSQQVGPYSGAGGYIPPSAVANSGFLTSPPINNYITVPISAMDSQDVMRRSSDIVAAWTKEMKLGGGNSDMNYYTNQAIFGAG